MTTSTKALIGLLLAGTIGMLTLLFVHLSSDPNKPISIGTTKAAAGCTKGARDCLPDVSYTDTTGHAYTQAQLTGKVVIVNFWATWCHPCQQEIPDLSKVYDKFKTKDVVFLGVMADNPDNQTLLNFQSDYEMTYPIVRSNSDIMMSFNYPDALPTTFVYDRSGKEVFNRRGGVHADELESLINRLVAEK